MPLYELECRSCGCHFEELVGAHVGIEAGDVRCPECDSAEVERLLTSYSPVPRGMTPNQRRRLAYKRGTNRDGAKERFQHQTAAERQAGTPGRGGRRWAGQSPRPRARAKQDTRTRPPVPAC